MKTIKRRKFWIIAPVVIFLMVVGIFLSANKIRDFYIKLRLDPQLELSQSLQKTAEMSNYTFQLKSEFTVEERKEVMSEVQGEKNQSGTHIKGEMVNTAIDIYYIDRTIYNYDSFSQKWLVIESSKNNADELLISELNPMSNFRFKQLNDVEKKGFDKIGTEECLIVECTPTVDNELLETMWKDYRYEFWIDYKQDVIRKAALEAVNQQNPQTKLYIELRLNDLNKDIHINPPDTGEGKRR